MMKKCCNTKGLTDLVKPFVRVDVGIDPYEYLIRCFVGADAHIRPLK